MKFKIVLTFQPIKNFKRIIPFCGLKQSFLALLPEIKHLFSVCQSNAMVYIIAPVFGVLQNGALAGFAVENTLSQPMQFFKPQLQLVDARLASSLSSFEVSRGFD
jgi:hypothetical protein